MFYCNMSYYSTVCYYRMIRSTVLMIYMIIVVLLQFCATRDHQQIIKLNNDGSVADASNLPKCSDGARINLLSYSILNENCIPNINCEVQLSPTQQVYIHQMCSLKEACEVMNLSIKDKRSDLNGRNFFLKVKYECLDHFTEFLDICENISKPIYNTVHLLSTQLYQAKKECHCSIKDGQFSLVLNDIRLLSPDGHSCSSSELQIGFDTFECMQRKGRNGSVFNRIFSETQMTSVSLILQNAQATNPVFPQMTWLIIKPKAPLRITCESTPRHYNTTTLNSIETSTTVNYTQFHPKEDSSSTLSVIQIVLICAGATIVLIVTGVVGFIVRGRCARPESFQKTPRSSAPKTSNRTEHGVTRTTYTDKETSVGASGKHKEKEVEMIPRVKQKQNVTIKDEASNKAENEEMDTLLNSIPPDWGERQQKQTVKSGQTYFPPYTEPAFTEYNTDAERWMTMQ